MSDLKEEAPDVMIEGFGDLVDHNSYTEYTRRYGDYDVRLEGFLEGYHARDEEIAALRWERDRLYAWGCSRTAVKTPDYVPFSELEARRQAIYWAGVAK